jgi:hypothetical protein
VFYGIGRIRHDFKTNRQDALISPAVSLTRPRVDLALPARFGHRLDTPAPLNRM